MPIIDSHLHVWSENGPKYGFDPTRAELLKTKASAEFLLEQMDAAGVAQTVVIQPITYRFNHTYVNESLGRHRDRFIGMCLVNPSDSDPAQMLERLIREGERAHATYRAVRINPNLYPQGVGLDSEISDRIFAKCAELKLVAGYLIDPKHFDAVGALAARHPKVRMVIDHFGHCHTKNGPVETNADFQKLLVMSKHANLHVKITEWPRASSVAWPHQDLHPWVNALLRVYGAKRLMWGTDFPFIIQQCGYQRGFTLLSEEMPGVAKDDMEWLLGKTAASVFAA